MTRTAPALLREWNLLQQQVIPPLVEAEPRPATVWSVGCAQDAVAVAVAYSHADGCAPSDLQLFMSERQPNLEAVNFTPADVRSVPLGSRSACFTREDRYWVPQAAITERVVMSEPSDEVDLVTYRMDEDGGRVPTDVVDRLNEGGQLLLVGSTADVPTPPGLRAVGRGRRVFRKRCTGSDRRRPPATVTSITETLADRHMRGQLVTTHLGLARSLARRFSRHGEPVEDLEQVACVALVKAARRYDPAQEVAFSSYATASILGELKRHFRDKAWMLRVPRSVQEMYLAVKDVREELSHRLGASPTPAQIAHHLQVEESAVLDALRAGDSYWPMSLDARGPNDTDGPEIPVVDAAFDRALEFRQLQQVMPRLDETEQLILRRLYFDGWTQRRVAESIGVSQMQVSRLLSRILAKLRDWIGETQAAS